MDHTLIRQALLAAALAAPLPAAAASHTATIRDMLRVTRLSDPQIAPDGSAIVFIETKPDTEHDENHSELAWLDIPAHAVRKLTTARLHAGSPRFSPNGDRLAFLAPAGGKKLQVFVLPLHGGEAAQVTHADEGVDQFAWSPDGKSFAFASTDAAPERKGEDKFRDAFRVRNDDFTLRESPRPSHVWSIDADGGTAKRLTSGSWSLPVSLPPGPPSSPMKWSSDGKSLLIVRQASPSTGDGFKTQIEVLDVATGEMRALTGGTLLEAYPVLSPDNTTVAYWRNRDQKPWFYQDVMLAPFTGGAGQDITVGLDKNIYGTWWMPDNATLLVGANDGTSVGLWLQPLAGKAQRLNLGDTMPSNGYWVDATVGQQGQIAYVGQTATDPYEIYLLPTKESAPARLTEVNAQLADIQLGRSETVHWKGPQGRELDGVVTYPPDASAGQKYPLVLVIHGGPNSASRQRFSVPTQFLASHGWIIFEPNYRGGDNKDNAFFSSIYKDAGQGPGEDVMSGVQYLESHGDIDSGRIAVSGWSYGGYMTTWLLGHYDIWKAAVAGAALTDFVDMYNVSDGNVTVTAQVGASPYVGDGMAEYRRQSPSSSYMNIKAPTLVMCDTGDFRVPITQSFSLYRALQDNHVESEFYAYPVGGHFPGDPIRQMDIWQRWADWLAKYLKT
jgi:dipeptidyl aminopeptidase/acylaminoacyl peptidase